MWVIQWRVAHIFEWSDQWNDWLHISKITKYPRMLQQRLSARFLFSPNFNYYIDLDALGELFVVRSAIDCDFEPVVFPRDMLRF